MLEEGATYELTYENFESIFKVLSPIALISICRLFRSTRTRATCRCGSGCCCSLRASGPASLLSTMYCSSSNTAIRRSACASSTARALTAEGRAWTARKTSETASAAQVWPTTTTSVKIDPSKVISSPDAVDFLSESVSKRNSRLELRPPAEGESEPDAYRGNVQDRLRKDMIIRQITTVYSTPSSLPHDSRFHSGKDDAAQEKVRHQLHPRPGLSSTKSEEVQLLLFAATPSRARRRILASWCASPRSSPGPRTLCDRELSAAVRNA